jgi:hypothetical protein
VKLDLKLAQMDQPALGADQIVEIKKMCVLKNRLKLFQLSFSLSAFDDLETVRRKREAAINALESFVIDTRFKIDQKVSDDLT